MHKSIAIGLEVRNEETVETGKIHRYRWVIAAIVVLAFLCQSAGSADLLKGVPGKLVHLLDAPIPEAKQSDYSPKIWKPLQHWPIKGVPVVVSENPVWTRAVKHPKKDLYIGVIKKVRINTPLQRVRDVMERYEDYVKMFPRVRKVEVLSREANKTLVRWEREAPVLLASHIRYDQIYLIDDRLKDRVIYRYQVVKSNSVNSTDGVIVVEASGGHTILTAWDFFDADWGILGTVAGGRIWRESMEGSYKGDIAFKSRCEHADWTRDQVEEEGERMLEKFPIRRIEYFEGDLFGDLAARGVTPRESEKEKSSKSIAAKEDI